MYHTGRLTALLDANVLYPAPVRDFLLDLAAQDLFRPKWSEKIQDEWIRRLLEKRPDLTEEVLIKTKTAMNLAFPDAIATSGRFLIRFE